MAGSKDIMTVKERRRLSIIRMIALDPTITPAEIAEKLGMNWDSPTVKRKITNDLAAVKSKVSSVLHAHNVTPMIAEHLLVVQELRRILIDNLRQQTERNVVIEEEITERETKDGVVKSRKIRKSRKMADPSTVKLIMDCIKTEEQLVQAQHVYGAEIRAYLDEENAEFETKKERRVTIEVVPGGRPKVIKANNDEPVKDAEIIEDNTDTDETVEQNAEAD